MLRVPKYERQVAPGSVPDVRINPGLQPEAYGSSGVARGLDQLAQVAIRQQDEVDRLEFSLLDAKADSFAGEFYEQEKRNGDYAGTIVRFRDAWKKHAAESLKNVPDRVREKAEALYEIKAAGYDAKFKGLFLEKQNDAIKRRLDDNVSEYVRLGDEAGLLRAVEGSTVLTQEQKGDVVRKGRRQIQLNAAQAAIREDPYRELDMSTFDTFDESDREHVSDFRLSEQAERETALRKEAAKTKNALFARYYETGGRTLWTQKDLDEARSGGRLDDDTYSDLMAARFSIIETREREARAEERAQQTQALALMTPEEKEFWKMQRSGTTETQNKSELERLGKLLQSDNLTVNDLIDSRARALITPTQEKEYRNMMNERSQITDAVYLGRAAENRKYLENIIKPLYAAGLMDMNRYNSVLIEYDAVTLSRRVTADHIDDYMRDVQNDIRMSTDWFGGSTYRRLIGSLPEEVRLVYDALDDLSKVPIAVEARGIHKKFDANRKNAKTEDTAPRPTGPILPLHVRREEESGESKSAPDKIPPKGDPARAEWIKRNL